MRSSLFVFLSRGVPRGVAVGLLAAIAGCSAISDRLAPGRVDERAAQVAFTVVLPETRANGAESIEVRSTYVLRDGSSMQLGQHVFPLGTAKTQALPLAIDLAVCLANPAHQPITGGDGCVVRLFVTLAVNGTTVDRQVIGPLQLAPGRVERVEEPVSLFEITALELALANGGALPTRPSVEIGSSLSLRAVIRDRNGQVVPDREVTWASDAPALASADGRGVVRALSAGTVTVTATLGSISQSVVVRVVRVPVEVSVRVASGSGRGRVRSGSAPLDCRIAANEATGQCSTRFAADSSLVLDAVAETGSVFGGWEGACAGRLDPQCRVSTTTAVSVAARFTALRRVRVSGSGDGRGRITGPEGLDCTVLGVNTAGVCEVRVPEGAAVLLRATPIASRSGGPESSFAGFAGDCPSMARECNYTVGASDVDVRVTFMEARRLRVVLDGDGDGRVEATAGIDCRREGSQVSGTCVIEAPHGTVVVLRAAGGTRGVFSSWKGQCTASGASECRVTLDGDRDVSASFSQLRRLVIESAGGDGQGRVTGPEGLDCQLNGSTAGGTCVVALAKTQVQLRVEPGRGQVFAGWSQPCAREVTCVVSLGDAETRIGVKLFGEQRVRVTFAGAGGGSVSSTPAAIQCRVSGGRTTGTCEGLAPWESLVTLTATEDSRSRFVGWSGPCTSSGRTCQIVLTETGVATAEFAPRLVSLALSTSGVGRGKITIDGQDACATVPGAVQTTCRIEVPIDSRVTVAAVAAAGSRTDGLTGDCVGSTSCTLQVSGPRSVDARFVPLPFVLRSTLTGSGAGTMFVNGSPVCTLTRGQQASTCSQSVLHGTTLSVMHVPDGSSLVSAVGSPCVLGAPCTVIVNGDLDLSSRFDIAARLTVTPLGAGGGRVSGGTIDCVLAAEQVTGNCSALFARGATVTLVASPDARSRVAGWSGACAPAEGNTCTVLLRESLGASVRFVPVP